MTLNPTELPPLFSIAIAVPLRYTLYFPEVPDVVLNVVPVWDTRVILSPAAINIAISPVEFTSLIIKNPLKLFAFELYASREGEYLWCKESELLLFFEEDLWFFLGDCLLIKDAKVCRSCVYFLICCKKCSLVSIVWELCLI